MVRYLVDNPLPGPALQAADASVFDSHFSIIIVITEDHAGLIVIITYYLGLEYKNESNMWEALLMQSAWKC